MTRALLAPLLTLAACGSQEAAAPQNEAGRISEQIDRQARQIANQAEHGVAAIEQALENESADIFENRAALLNESGNSAR